MENEKTTNERLASLEAKLEFLKELLKEIRDDVKEQPSREEYNKLEERVSNLESAHTKLREKYSSLMVKVGITSGLVLVAVELGLKLFLK